VRAFHSYEFIIFICQILWKLCSASKIEVNADNKVGQSFCDAVYIEARLSLG